MIRKLKHAIGLTIGMPICKLPLLQKYKFHLFSSWVQREKKKRLDNYIFSAVLSYWFRFEYLSEKDPDKRESLKKMFMGGKSGAEWAKVYNNRLLNFEAKVGHLTHNEARPLLSRLDKMLSSIIESLVVFQIGSSSGREIAWLAKKNPVHTYIGIDIYSEVIAYSSEIHNLSNLSFEICSAKDISNLLNEYKGRRKIIFSSGSLQYVQPEHIEKFFDSISRIPKLELIISEPADELKCNPEELKGSLWRGNFSYTHNYRYYAEQSDLITQTCEIIRPYFPYEDFPKHRNTIHYFYWARTKNNFE